MPITVIWSFNSPGSAQGSRAELEGFLFECNPHRRGFECLNVIMLRWFSLIRVTGNSYRPELHYMRGPGPKWYAKHQDLLRTASVDTASSCRETTPLVERRPSFPVRTFHKTESQKE